MANTAQARKRARQNLKRRARNRALRSRLRTAIKAVRLAIAAGDKEKAQQSFVASQSVIDKMVTKGIIHKNTAARYKRRLSARIKVLGSKQTA
ncbi:MAG: 30S ribosomal protein S20 [Hydrogenophilus sp.]|nr:30S ribosomal protein S20 [Hydrogenophilus sp.]